MKTLKERVIDALIDHYVVSMDSVLETGRQLSESSSIEEEYGADRLGSKKEEMMADAEAIVNTESNIESTLLSLRNIDHGSNNGTAQVGSLIITDGNMHYLLATATIPVEIDGRTYIGISTQSPVGSKIEGMKIGQRVEVLDNSFTIKDIQ